MTFGFEMKQAADKVNQQQAEEKSKQYFGFIKEDCVKAAKMGRYRITLEYQKYRELYENNPNTGTNIIMPILEKRLNKEGLTIKKVQQGTYDSELYQVSFRDATEAEANELHTNTF